jgi:hypothetical protein
MVRTWDKPELLVLRSGAEAEECNANKIQTFPESPASSGDPGVGCPGDPDEGLGPS